MSAHATDSSRRLCIWAETPGQRRFVEARLPTYRRGILSLFSRGPELADTIATSKPDGIIFYSENLSLAQSTLGFLEEKCPQCARFVVCTKKTDSLFRKWVGIAPTLLETDETAEIWEARIERAITVNQWLMQPEFLLLLPRLRNIPSLPDSHRRVCAILRNPQFDLNEVAKIINQDVGLTAQLLKVVNSAALGLAHPVHSVATAVGLVGAIRLQCLIMSAWAFSFANEDMCKGFSPTAAWQHAVSVADATQLLARERRASIEITEEAYTAGMLHDIGKVMLAANSPEVYGGILALAKLKGQPIWEIEKEVLGYTHAEVGACLLGLWGLDLPIVQAVAAHHQPPPASEPEGSLRTLIFEANRKANAP